MSSIKIAIGCDHAGFNLKEVIKTTFQDSYEFIDFGCNGPDSVDYPDHAHPVANAVESDDALLGILICGSGNGINMTANKHAGIRSALCWETEIASLARQHNNANIVALPARYLDDNKAIKIVEAFLSTSFEGGRHERRVEKILC